MRSVDKQDYVADLEQQLKQSLRKVEPSPDFISHLQNRLSDPSKPKLEKGESFGCGFLIVAFFSLLAAAFLLWMIDHLRTSKTKQHS